MPDSIGQVIRAVGQNSSASSDFDLNPDIVLPKGRTLRPAGVLIAIEQREGKPHVIFTKRSSHLKHHPGQIAFPGGKQEDNDATVVEAALREAEEEIGLPSPIVEVLGTLPTHETVTGFVVTPVLGKVRKSFEIISEPGEVEDVFSVPLAHVTNPARFSIQSRLWNGMQRNYYTVPFGPYYIWGATARILRGLADRIHVS